MRQAMTPLNELRSLLTALERSSTLPLEQAHALPGSVYTSASFLDRELERIFRQEWQCVGRSLDLPECGDYLTRDLADEPVIVLRDHNERLRAYANVCRHRMSTLLSGKGSVKKIQCPYHAWTYDLDGRLVAAPFTPEDFDPSTIALHELSLEEWQGWIYVSLDANAKSLTPQLRELERAYANYRMEDYEPLYRQTWTWETNWKCLLENFMDPLHIFQVHKKTIEPVLPTRNGRPIPGGPLHSLYVQTRTEGATYEYKNPKHLNLHLTEEERSTYPVFCVYPSHLVGLSADRLVWMSLQPEATNRTRVSWGVEMFPGLLDNDGPSVEEISATFDEINAEDESIVRGVYRNARSAFAVPGPLTRKELPVWEFQKYLASKLL